MPRAPLPQQGEKKKQKKKKTMTMAVMKMPLLPHFHRHHRRRRFRRPQLYLSLIVSDDMANRHRVIFRGGGGGTMLRNEWAMEIKTTQYT